MEKKRITKEEMKKNIYWGLYDNIQGLEPKGSNLIPILDNPTTEMELTNNIAIDVKLANLFDAEIHGEPLDYNSVIGFYNPTYADVFISRDMNDHEKILMNTETMKTFKECLNEVRQELIDRADWGYHTYEEDMDMVKEDIENLCYNRGN